MAAAGGLLAGCGGLGHSDSFGGWGGEKKNAATRKKKIAERRIFDKEGDGVTEKRRNGKRGAERFGGSSVRDEMEQCDKCWGRKGGGWGT